MKKMKILIDTCIIVTREGCDIKGNEHLDGDILELFKIIVNNHIECYIHPISIQEIQKSISTQNKTTRIIREQTLSKTRVYHLLDAPDPYQEQSRESKDYLDRIDPGREALGSGKKASHDKNDNILLYAAYHYRGYISLITEDKDILKKAQHLGLQNVYSVKSALEYFKNYYHYFLSAYSSGTIVAPGDTLHIRGTAIGDPGILKMYLFGPNYFTAESIFAEGDDGSYDKKFDVPADLSPNQYFAVIQHPMYNDEFDVKLNSDGTRFCGSTSQDTLVVKGNNKLQGAQAADALTKMIDDANIDDIYTKLTFTVAAPWIRIVNPGDQAAGSKFTITGTTNLAVDDQILVEVMFSSFTAADKTSTSTTSGVSQTTKVVKGDTDNTWSVDVDTTNWKLGEYTIKVNGIEVDVTTTTNFNLVEKVLRFFPRCPRRFVRLHFYAVLCGFTVLKYIYHWVLISHSETRARLLPKRKRGNNHDRAGRRVKKF